MDGAADPARFEGAAESTGVHDTADRVRLFWRVRRASRPRAALLIAHGVCEHSGRYRPLSEALVHGGVTTYAFDQRGHGRSDGPRVHVERWGVYRRDLLGLIGRVRTLEPALPLFVMGHSMGAMIVLDLLAEQGDRVRDTVRGWVISAVGLRPTGVAKGGRVVLARWLSRVAPRLRLDLGIEASSLSHDPTVTRAYREDPMVERRATVRWGSEALAAVARLDDRIASLEARLLILHGDADPLVHVEGARELARRVRGEAELRVYPGGLHEPHNDRGHADASGDILAWIDRIIAVP